MLLCAGREARQNFKERLVSWDYLPGSSFTWLWMASPRPLKNTHLVVVLLMLAVSPSHGSRLLGQTAHLFFLDAQNISTLKREQPLLLSERGTRHKVIFLLEILPTALFPSQSWQHAQSSPLGRWKSSALEDSSGASQVIAWRQRMQPCAEVSSW